MMDQNNHPNQKPLHSNKTKQPTGTSGGSCKLNSNQVFNPPSSMVMLFTTLILIALISSNQPRIKTNTNVYHTSDSNSQAFSTSSSGANLRATSHLVSQRSQNDNTFSSLYQEAKQWPFQMFNELSMAGVYAFNLDTHKPVVHKGSSGDMFGYTVAQHKDRGQPWLLVGAPLAQTAQKGLERPGAVYKCVPMQTDACQQIRIDPNGNNKIQLGDKQRAVEDKSNQWFGASLHSSGESGNIVACAPKYVYFSSDLKRRDPVGSCYASRGSLDGFLEYSPCRLNDQWGHHQLGACQAGFSSAISKDGNRLFMGAPGAHVWQGQVFSHNLKTDLHNSTSGVNPHSEDDSYLGYSLTVGRFGGSSSVSPGASAGDTDLAIGIPRGNDLMGKVMIVDRYMRTMRNLTGEQMGSYFGYSMATADVNGDGLDDIIIGAPLFYNRTQAHKEPNFERGRVYIGLQSKRGEFSLATKLDGRVNGARFGTAVANCGDLNRDGYQDIAVGAPYDGERGRGAIYIFMGKKQSGPSSDYDQVIHAEDVSVGGPQLGAFGFSLSGGLDLDGNSYPDLLVGDYANDQAIMLRSRPVVEVSHSISFEPEYLNLDEKNCPLPSNSSQRVPCFTVTYCTRYTGHQVDSSSMFNYHIKLDTDSAEKGAPRLFFLTKESNTEDRVSQMLTKDVEKCKNFKAFVMRQIRDKLTPMKVEIEYQLASESVDNHESTRPRPILSRSSPNKMVKAANIQKNCGADNICVPDLKVNINANTNIYTIGSNDKIVLDVTIRNTGEDAFESMFYLTMPMSINYITINRTRNDYPVCYGAKPDQTGVNILSCDLGNPQPKNDLIKFSVITEPARTQTTISDFTFEALVNSTNSELNAEHLRDNKMALGIAVRAEASLIVSGSSKPPQVVYNATAAQMNRDLGSWSSARGLELAYQPAEFTKEDQLGPEIYHLYQIQNRGPSTIGDIAVTILWPTKNSQGDYLLYLVDEPIASDKQKVKCRPAPANAINPMSLKYQSDLKVGVENEQTATGVIRNKRQTNDVPTKSSPTSAASTVDQPVLHDLTSDCGPTQCTRFECNIYNLAKNELVSLYIRSRLFNETITKLSIQEFDISSNLVAQIKSLPHNHSSLIVTPYHHKVGTQVHIIGSPMQDMLPWWLILLAILLGISLFILLAWFLKYLGFFARKRPPKGAEREPLTPIMWNDYQYSPGDTAL